jgi:hypothetical protein
MIDYGEPIQQIATLRKDINGAFWLKVDTKKQNP